MNTSHRPSLYKKVGNAAVALAILLIVVGGGGYYLYMTFFSGSDIDEAIRWKFTKPRVGEFEHVIIEKGDVESLSLIHI